jgi:CRP/FNR family transcriptional regulator, cyclic AMP receptor protein
MLGRVPTAVASSLADMALFANCTRREMAAVARLGTVVHVKPGATLTRQDHPGREFVLVMDGQAECLINGRTAASYRRGDFFGELSLLSGGPRTATVTMMSAGELLVFDRREFFQLLDCAPSVVKALLVEVVRRQRVTTGLLVSA